MSLNYAMGVEGGRGKGSGWGGVLVDYGAGKECVLVIVFEC